MISPLMPDSFGDSSTKNMPEGVKEHTPVIWVEVGEVEYAKFAYNKENAFSVCLIIAAELKHLKLICLKLLCFFLLLP